MDAEKEKMPEVCKNKWGREMGKPYWVKDWEVDRLNSDFSSYSAVTKEI